MKTAAAGTAAVETTTLMARMKKFLRLGPQMKATDKHG